MKSLNLKQLIKEEIANVIAENKNKKGNKKSLKEGYAWERSEHKFGQSLPTLASVQKAYQAKHNITEASKGELIRFIGLASGELKKSVYSLETYLEKSNVTLDYKKLAEIVVDIIDAAKDEERNEISDN